MIADAGGSLWNIRAWEALTPLAVVVAWFSLSELISVRARRNRAALRRVRRSERELTRRMRAW